jgi:tRNA1Val (adenine37-N6)-methyltransferase
MTITTPADQLKAAGKATGTFYFKQFKVKDDRSTMKVGTDAVLLGVVAAVEKAFDILEIGTGCGVIALMLAQRSQALIDAIEIDEESVKQARKNAGNSPWNDRINIIHSSLHEFVKQSDKKYSLVISNPPFFSRSLKSPDKKRNAARHNDSLSFIELLDGSSQIMMPGASLWVILPIKECKEFIETAANKGFFIHYKMEITSRQGKEYHRIILQLKKIPAGKIHERVLAIKTQDNSFTKEYKEMTREFYIDF